MNRGLYEGFIRDNKCWLRQIFNEVPVEFPITVVKLEDNRNNTKRSHLALCDCVPNGITGRKKRVEPVQIDCVYLIDRMLRTRIPDYTRTGRSCSIR